MSSNSEIRPLNETSEMINRYSDPKLIKEGAVSCLYRVSRAGKYFIIKTAKDSTGIMNDLIRREYELSIGLSTHMSSMSSRLKILLLSAQAL